MEKTIAIRGTAFIFKAYNDLQEIAGDQNTSRAALTEKMIKYISELPKNEDSVKELKRASTKRYRNLPVEYPSSIKFTISISEEVWNRAIDIMKFAFPPIKSVQISYLIRIASVAYYNSLYRENEKLMEEEEPKIAEKTQKYPTLEEFGTLEVNEKLDIIYGLLLEERRKNNERR